MMKFLHLLIFCLATSYTCYGQTPTVELKTDRPDQTESSALIPKGSLQVETGFIVEPDKDVTSKTTNYTFNTTLVKFGLTDFLELRLITEYLQERTEIRENGITTKRQGFSPLALGIKTKLSEENGIIPEAAFIGHINLNANRGDFRPKYTAVDFRFTLSHTLTDNLSFGYNIGAEWDGEKLDPDYIYTVTLAYSLSEKFGCFVEGYGFIAESHGADHRLDCGLTYLITPRVQWDISGGIGVTPIAPNAFGSTGLSFRLFK